MTFWRNGFIIEGSELMSYDDPVNARILDEINAGRAPPSIFNVKTGQRVEVLLANRMREDYVPSVAGQSPLETQEDGE
ncbi:SEP-domain-containing protein [Trametopsis cervina]|nr:SEP-domain-containing protein [Trametopsis cervina]